MLLFRRQGEELPNRAHHLVHAQRTTENALPRPSGRGDRGSGEENHGRCAKALDQGTQHASRRPVDCLLIEDDESQRTTTDGVDARQHGVAKTRRTDGVIAELAERGSEKGPPPLVGHDHHDTGRKRRSRSVTVV